MKKLCYIQTIYGQVLIAKDRNLFFVIFSNEVYEVFTDKTRAINYIQSIRTPEAA